MNITTSIEKPRACGLRQKGYYLMSDSMAQTCGFFPIKIEACKCCGAKLKPVRSISAVSVTMVTHGQEECAFMDHYESCSRCMFSQYLAEKNKNPLLNKLFVDWVGKSFYPDPYDFAKEADRMGISRRFNGKLPEGFVVGEDWILLAHTEAWPAGVDIFDEGIFSAYKPNRIEYVIGGDETEEELMEIEKKEIQLVRVILDTSDTQMSIEFDERSVHGLADALRVGELRAVEDFFQTNFPEDFGTCSLIINGNLDRGIYKRLATKCYNHAKKEKHLTEDRSRLWRKYAELRVQEYRKEIENL